MSQEEVDEGNYSQSAQLPLEIQRRLLSKTKTDKVNALLKKSIIFSV
jgi:hypothetical protein